jgi:hypothetical protein
MKEKLPIYITILDGFLHPFMIILNGFNGDSTQRTHPWHGKNIDRYKVNETNSIRVEGRDPSKVKDIWCGLFHMPIVGGWKSYVILKPKNKIDLWYIGWKTEKYCQVNRIPLKNLVKMLNGVKGSETFFFGMNKDEALIELEIVDFGENGDKKYKDVPLL